MTNLQSSGITSDVPPAVARANVQAIVAQAMVVDLVAGGFHQLDVLVSDPTQPGATSVDPTTIWVRVDVSLDCDPRTVTVTNDVDQGRRVTLSRTVTKTVYVRADDPPAGVHALVASAAALLPGMASNTPDAAAHGAIDRFPSVHASWVALGNLQSRPAVTP